MSNPTLYKWIYIAWGVYAAAAVPTLAWMYHSPWLAAVSIPVMVIFGMGALMTAQYMPNSGPLGPSLLAGFALLTFYMLMPLLVLPGAVWWFVLPFDEAGYFSTDAILSLDLEAIEEPYHE